MTDNEKLIEAAKMLQENCQSKNPKCCEGCSFDKGGSCRLQGGIPYTWDIPKPRRFTVADIALAKALKLFGHVRVERCNGNTYCTSTNEEYSDDVHLPEDAYESIKDGETVPIDDIIREGENE